MNIQYVAGDVLTCTQPVLIHGCNDRGVMGSGVARQIRAKWPQVYEAYRVHYDTHGLQLGELICVQTPDVMVVNAITQHLFGRDGGVYVDYAAIEACYQKLNELMAEWQHTEAAMPRVGAGLGGGDWATISEIIERTATYYVPVVYDYYQAP
jgi:O-acetyl-ADP-ribose deacetylase (regulator of RNase III)